MTRKWTSRDSGREYQKVFEAFEHALVKEEFITGAFEAQILVSGDAGTRKVIVGAIRKRLKDKDADITSELDSLVKDITQLTEAGDKPLTVGDVDRLLKEAIATAASEKPIHTSPHIH